MFIQLFGNHWAMSAMQKFNRMLSTLVFATIVLINMALVTNANAEDIEDRLIRSAYAAGGKTLYCQTPFKPGDRIKVDYIYSEKQLLRHFNCITSRQCSSKPGYDDVGGDLHNIYPIERSIEIKRRGSLFGDLPDSVEERECGYQLSYQTFDPPDHAKGNVARAMIYMHMQHDLPLIGPLVTYQRWNKMDPPDDAERARNNAIERVQKNRNPYIDKPELIDKMNGF